MVTFGREEDMEKGGCESSGFSSNMPQNSAKNSAGKHKEEIFSWVRIRGLACFVTRTNFARKQLH